MQNNSEQTPMITSMSTKVHVLVMSYQNYEMYGYLYSPFYDEYFRFSNAMDLIVQMNGLFDQLRFPQSSVEYRSFHNKRNRSDATERDDVVVSDMVQNENAQAKFIIHVQFRQNATWQGTIEWVDENRMQRFRSTLEMLKLMEEALDAGEEEADMNSFKR